jgi:hypothetical protein
VRRFRSGGVHRSAATRATLVAICCVPLCAVVAGAQPTTDRTAQADQEDIETREQFVWHPSVGITSLGYDSNVFNLPTRGAGDWVATFAAGLAPIWNVGDVKLSADTDLVYNYFQQFTQERGLDGSARGRIDLPIARVRLHVGGSYANLRQRVNFEIDQRARRTEHDLTAGFDVAAGGRTTIGLNVRRGLVRFADDEPGTQTLRDTLNRDERTASASVQYAITPLTSFVVTGDLGTHHFDRSPQRDGHGAGYSAGLMLAQDAVIAGQVSIGWRRVTVSTPLVPAFQGLAWLMDLSTVMGNSTRVGVRGRRDVAFSSDVQAPYYVQSSIGGSLRQALGDGWEIGVRIDRVWLDYAHSLIETAPAYAETIDVPGALLGYRFPGGVRIGVEVESQQRRVNTPGSGRAYRTLRTYTVISKSIGS